MKLRLYRTERETVSGKIVLTNDEVKHIFGKVPSRNQKTISNHFRVHMGVVEQRKLLTVRHAEVPEDTSRLVAPWLRPYGKVAWFITPTQEVVNKLSMQAYGKAQGTERDAFVDLKLIHMNVAGLIRVPVKLLDTDAPEPVEELTPEQQAYQALNLVNEFIAANPGRFLLSVNNNQASIWTRPQA
jgi:hypothetical protein